MSDVDVAPENGIIRYYTVLDTHHVHPTSTTSTLIQQNVSTTYHHYITMAAVEYTNGRKLVSQTIMYFFSCLFSHSLMIDGLLNLGYIQGLQ